MECKRRLAWNTNEWIKKTRNLLACAKDTASSIKRIQQTGNKKNQKATKTCWAARIVDRNSSCKRAHTHTHRQWMSGTTKNGIRWIVFIVRAFNVQLLKVVSNKRNKNGILATETVSYCRRFVFRRYRRWCLFLSLLDCDSVLSNDDTMHIVCIFGLDVAWFWHFCNTSEIHSDNLYAHCATFWFTLGT